MSSQPLEPHIPPPALPPAAGPYVRLPKSPGLAAFLSLFPGLGQVYNGHIARAFVFFFAWVGSIYLTASGHEFPFAFVIPFVYLFNLIDAWKGATAKNARFLGGGIGPTRSERRVAGVGRVACPVRRAHPVQQPRLARPRPPRALVAAAADRRGRVLRLRVAAEAQGGGVRG